jgi:putative membrane-bound dehydrogenase-like protein
MRDVRSENPCPMVRILSHGFLLVLTISLAYLPVSKLFAEEPAPEVDEGEFELPRIDPLPPEQATAAIRVQPGFRVEQVAAEPLVRDPIAMDFDENGRAYVIELPTYNQHAAPDSNLKSGIRVLEDTNGDGLFDKSTLFADDLTYATGLLCYDGGVFVGDAPDLLYLKDTNGDGRADLREVLFTGFGTDRAGEGQLNSFRWRLDNRVHVCTGQDGGDVRLANAAADAPKWSVRNRGFIFDPKTREVELTSGGGQYGMSFDDWGNVYVCGNSDPCQLLVYDDRYLRNPWMTAPAAAVSIAPDVKYTMVMRISPFDPWREVRTQLRSAGKFAGSDEGGEIGGFFTAGTGVTIYRGHAWPPSHHGSLLVGEAASNLVYRARLEPNGLMQIARRADADADFLAATDNWFRPVHFTHGPDGNLYVMDMYRELIEGADFLPPPLLAKMDPTAGSDMGRIYRIVAADFQQPPPVKLGEKSTAELVTLLEHPNGWHRDTAARLLYQRQDPAAVEPLRKLSRESASPQGRLHAWYALQSLNALQAEDVVAALTDPHPRLRQHGSRLAEPLASDSPEIQQHIISLVGDEDASVRFQLAFSAGYLPRESRDQVLSKLVLSDGASHWFQMAVQSSVGEGAQGLLKQLIADVPFRQSAHGSEFIATLAKQIGRRNNTDEIQQCLVAMHAMTQSDADAEPIAKLMVTSLLDNREGTVARMIDDSSAGGVGNMVLRIIEEARTAALDENKPDEARSKAIQTLGASTFAAEQETFAKLLQPQQSQAVQEAAISVVAHYKDTEVAELMLGSWATFTPRLRALATEVLFSRVAWTNLLLDAVESGDIGRGNIDPARIDLLKSHPDDQLKQRAAQVFEGTGVAERAAVLEKYLPALELVADVQRGRLAFRKVCAACHRLEDEGTAIGADLQAIRQRGNEAVLLNILDPNREVKPQFLTYVVATTSGQTITGMITDETPTNLTIRQPDGTPVVIARIDIEEITSTGRSYMPEGLEQQLDPQAMADVMAYLNSIK